MKKSRSSVPLFIDNEPPEPDPPVKYEGLFPTAGLPDPEPPDPPGPPFVAMAVGKTNDGASLPAKPLARLAKRLYIFISLSRTQLRVSCAAVVKLESLPIQ